MNRPRLRALLLEHDDALRQLFVDALTHLGWAALAGKGRKEMLDLLLQEPDPDLIVVDLVDRQSGGNALLCFLGEQPETARIPLVVMTDGDPAKAPPGAAWLSKPFGLEELQAAVEQAMRSAMTLPGSQTTSVAPSTGG